MDVDYSHVTAAVDLILAHYVQCNAIQWNAMLYSREVKRVGE